MDIHKDDTAVNVHITRRTINSFSVKPCVVKMRRRRLDGRVDVLVIKTRAEKEIMYSHGILLETASSDCKY